MNMWATDKLKRLKFGKPDFNDLVRRGYMLFDMHVHTNVSDGTCSAQAILRRAKELGIGVAISDHDKASAALGSFENEYGVPVIPSMEVEAKTGEHFLYYFVDPADLEVFYENEIKGMECKRSIKDLLSLKKRYNTLISWAHPAGAPPQSWLFWRDWKFNLELISKIDCLELFNGHAARKTVGKVAQWVLKYHKPYTGGSDAHELAQLGRVVTCAKARNVAEFLEKVRKRKVRIIGQRVNFYRFMMKYPFKYAFAKLNYMMKF
jgi:predicted metal-dependent phosphoesterase TrpH